MFKTVIEIIGALYGAGILTAIASFALKFLKTKIKNQKLLTLATYAEQAVNRAETVANSNEAKYSEALGYLTTLIDKSGIKFDVPAEQKKALIETAVKVLKQNLK